ncbi:DEKNAAC103503 [Brettanomyces naardenensis]|uniref:DEKNAAC103503 n=1 Tax=Brettanomyces naardenensis TaxID=13370 RepID=A0A448YNJ6_BRENA|nr:DEKNAAC103503 [Brettanomyces naardenensis]
MAIRQGKIEDNQWEKQTLPALGGKPALELYCSNGNGTQLPAPRKQNVFKGEDDEDDVDHLPEKRQHQDADHPLRKRPSIVIKVPKKRKAKVSKPNKASRAETATEVNSESDDSLLVTYNNTNDGVLDRLSSEERKKLRGKRFERELNYTPPAETSGSMNIDTNKLFVGKCTTLEKRYLRLTSEPNPLLVRPVNVLRKTLQLLVDKYLGGATYNYLCDQLKSTRQDLTVQNIRTDFTVMVYEFHSKLAIEFGDLGEFNQCQSQLKLLYEGRNIKGADRYEYFAYRVLYCIITNVPSEALTLKLKVLSERGNRRDRVPFIDDAFKALDLFITGDVYQLIELAKKVRAQNEQEEKTAHPKSHIDIYKDPNALRLNHTSLYFFYKFLDQILDRERIHALATLCHSFRRIPMDFLKDNLMLDRDNQLINFCKKIKITKFVQKTDNDDDSNFLDCSNARPLVDSLKASTYRRIDIKGQV